jgi:hypothetical protein
MGGLEKSEKWKMRENEGKNGNASRNTLLIKPLRKKGKGEEEVRREDRVVGSEAFRCRMHQAAGRPRPRRRGRPSRAAGTINPQQQA